MVTKGRRVRTFEFVRPGPAGLVASASRSRCGATPRHEELGRYPVAVLHDGLSEAAREEIRGASPNEVWFLSVALPSFAGVARSGFDPGWREGYRAMAQWYAIDSQDLGEARTIPSSTGGRKVVSQ